MTERPDEDLSIGEHSGHVAARPISWAVVVAVCIGFLVAGIALTIPAPWLFYVGAALVVLGTIVGWATHAMADLTTRVETPARIDSASEKNEPART